MNPFCHGVVLGVLSMVLLGIIFVYSENTLYTRQYARRKKVKYMPKNQFHFDNLSRKSTCKVDVVDNLATSGLKKIQDKRKSRIKNVCDMCRRNRTSMECNHVTVDEDEHDKVIYSSLLVDDMHKVIYCIVPKGGCTNWKKVILKSVSGREVTAQEVHDRGVMHRQNLRRLSNYSKSEIDHKLKTYFKFLVARHPLERLLSAYRSKFGNPRVVQTGFTKYVPYIRRHGHGENSFSNFVEFLSRIYDITREYFSHEFTPGEIDPQTVDSKWRYDITKRLDEKHILRKGSRYFEEHWAQYSTLCHPCHIDYDYIVKLETMREDAAYVLSKLGPHHKCLEDKYPDLFSFVQHTSTVFDEYYSRLSSDQINRIKEMYSIDFKLFGYEN